MVIKGTIFGGKPQNILVRRHGLNYTDILLLTHIYLRYVVIYVVLITVMLEI